MGRGWHNLQKGDLPPKTIEHICRMNVAHLAAKENNQGPSTGNGKKTTFFQKLFNDNREFEANSSGVFYLRHCKKDGSEQGRHGTESCHEYSGFVVIVMSTFL